jgi:hypothetical protein
MNSERRLSVLYVWVSWRALSQYAIQDHTRERLGLLYSVMDYNGKNDDNARHYEVSNHNSYWAIKCTNSGCLEQLKPRLWNRDLAAVLNFKKILTSLREKRPRPELFTRTKTEESFTKVIAIS